MNYPLGKTPLPERVLRWAEYTNLDPSRDTVPIHPTEYCSLLDSAKFTGRVAGFKVRPVGGAPWEI